MAAPTDLSVLPCRSKAAKATRIFLVSKQAQSLESPQGVGFTSVSCLEVGRQVQFGFVPKQNKAL